MRLAAVGLLLTAAPITGWAQQAPVRAAAERDAAGVQPMETRVYNVADLVRPGDEDLVERWMRSSSRPQVKVDAGGFGSGGLGGMGGGGMEGGGVFAIPPHIQPQFGGAGMAAHGPWMGSADGGEQTAGDLVMLIQEIIRGGAIDDGGDPRGPTVRWEDIDGQGGTIREYGELLIVNHTAAVHARIDEFLSMLRKQLAPTPVIHVDVRMLIVESEVAAQLAEERVGPERAAELAADPRALQVSVRCGNRRAAQIAAGIRRSYVVGAVPVVGGAERGIGYQPVTVMPVIGLFGQIQPTLVDAPDERSADIRLGLVLAAGADEVSVSEYGNGVTVDRLELSTAEIETTARALVDQYVLAGVVTVGDAATGVQEGATVQHLLVLVRWEIAE